MDLDVQCRMPMPCVPETGRLRSLCHDDGGEPGQGSVVRDH